MKKKKDIFSAILQDPGFQADEKKPPIIKVMGVGGGGVNAVNRIYEQHLEDVTYAVVNTDSASLQDSPVPFKLVLGNGRGAGDKPDVAQKAAQESEKEIADMLSDGTQMVFVTASLGGGTGTGAAPVVAKVAHEIGLLTVGVVTIPFQFEGDLKIRKALKGAEEMSKYVDSLIVINNQKLIECYPDSTMIYNFAVADETLAKAVTSISNLVNIVGFWNIDFNDIDTTLRQTRVAIISTGYGSGTNRVSKAIEAALDSPLLRNRDVYGASRLLIAVHTSSNQEYSLRGEEVTEIQNFKYKFRNELEQITGWYFDDALDDEVGFTLLAAGFDMSFDEKFDSDENDSFFVLRPEDMDDDAVIQMMEKTPAFNRINQPIPASAARPKSKKGTIPIQF